MMVRKRVMRIDRAATTAVGLLVLATTVVGCTNDSAPMPSSSADPRVSTLMEWAEDAGEKGVAGHLFCGEETATGEDPPAREAWEWDGTFTPFEHFEVDSDGDPRVPDGTPVDVAKMTYPNGTVLYVEVLSQGDTACIAGAMGEEYYLSRVEEMSATPKP